MRQSKRGKDLGPLVDFIAEAGLLKLTRRSGWSVLGIKNAESVAEHSFRCAVIGYLLAKTERACGYKVLLMTLLNDVHEARITDLHKMAQRYFDIEKAEDSSYREQIGSLPPDIKSELSLLRREYTAQKTKESIVARDADILECLVQAKEYHDFGYARAHQFMRKAPEFLKTKSARRLWRLAKDKDLNSWWLGLSRFKR